MFLCDGLAAAANAGFQFSKHLGIPDLPCLLNMCKKKKKKSEREELHNKPCVKVKETHVVEKV